MVRSRRVEAMIADSSFEMIDEQPDEDVRGEGRGGERKKYL